MIVLRKIYSILTPAERKAGLGLLGLTAIGMALETLGIGLIVPAIALLMQDDLRTSYPQLRPILDVLGNPGPKQLMSVGMLFLVALYLIKNVFLGYFLWRQNRFTNNVRAELSRRLFTIYLRQPYTFHLETNSAHLMRNVIGEAGTFTGTLTHAVNLLTESSVLLGLAVLLLLIEPVGTLVVVVALGVAGWAFYRISKAHTTRWGHARHYHEALLLQHLQQGLGGAKDVKLLGREAGFLQQFQVHNVESARAIEFQATISQLPRLWLELLAVVGLATLVMSMLAQGRSLSSIVPTVVLFAAAAFRIMPSVNRLLAAIQALRYGLPAINALQHEIRRPAPDPVPHRDGPWRPFQRDIRLSAVTFTYPSAAVPALRDISLTIRKGESVGFVGTSGSGKSTLIDVLLGLLTPSAGQVIVDGHDIQANLRSWQRQIGYVSQSIYLTDDTLRRNVAFGIAEAEIDNAAVTRALRAAQLEEFVAGLPKGWDTDVGERGVRLSGGQRQRIGIARALYHDPSVLVLDEATSALDTATERDVMDAVIALHNTKTILIVAHRLSTVEHCDRLYQLEDGTAAEQETPHHPAA